MENLYDNANTSNYYSPQEPDEISLCLQQILLRSSSSSLHSFLRQQSLFPALDHAAAAAVLGQISAAVPSSELNSCSTCGFVAAAAANVSPSSAGNLDAEMDDCDYESEEAVEALVAETMAKAAALPRCSSKRTRAAEAHNLSEKRRRSRINKKMKALQNLIPNSNKTDKASMLDEDIEYLKQLQLQDQMLTMRNGLRLYPICMPGALQSNQVSQTRVDVYDADKYANINMMKEISMNQNISADLLLKLPENCVKQEQLCDFSSMIGSKPSLLVESSIQQHHFGAFQLSTSYKKKEKAVPRQPSIGDFPQSSSAGANVTSSIPSETQTSDLKENVVEGCVAAAAEVLQTMLIVQSSHYN